jgi:trehalose synthase
MIDLSKAIEIIQQNALLRGQGDVSAGDVKAAREYVASYWQRVERFHPQDDDTLLGLPKPYIIPSFDEAANFDYDELYYWDSYFIVQGLLDTAHQELVCGILEDLMSLFKRFKVIPNASRVYLTGRSQPPLLTSLIFDVYEAFKLDKDWLKGAMSIAKQEYAIVWMGTKKPDDRRVYQGLSRYYDVNMLNDLAEAESGWDMTPRFDRHALHYLPVDLNALLYKYETDFARGARILGNESEAVEWDKAAGARKDVMNELMWDRIRGLYYDFNFVKEHRGNTSSLAAYYPMWAGMVDANQAAAMVRALRRFEHAGGLSTTDALPMRQYVAGTIPTQWAYPNGWAPLQFIVIKGLERYGYHDDARRIAMKWLRCNLRWFKAHGVFLEKYNVVNPEKPPVKGVYPTQTGFGWTNAVFERLCRDYIDNQLHGRPSKNARHDEIRRLAEVPAGRRSADHAYDERIAQSKAKDATGIMLARTEGVYFPARPKRLWSHARDFMRKPFAAAAKIGSPRASNAAYVRWLRRQSMLASADKLSKKYSGQASMWRNPYGQPRPSAAVRKAGVWFVSYPNSYITRAGQSILAAMGDDVLWQQFETIGISAIHTGPMKLAGGLDGWDPTPSVDGHFDRMSVQIDPIFGSETEFRSLCQVAKRHGGVVIDDIVPGHTGKGADFRLAEMKYKEYPGIYHMVDIDPKDWYLLPEVPEGKDSVNISPETEHILKKNHYIVGELHRVMFYEKGVKETNWSVSRPVRGVDGMVRRWVYFHTFWDGQPNINWLDPSFAGMRLVIGDALHSLGELGTGGLRLDANGFLGIEKVGEEEPAWGEGHPLSLAANAIMAGMVRKLGGFTYQELNLTFEDIKATSQFGADLSYDCVNRPGYDHALATGDTEFLRLCMRSALDVGINPVSLVHALQNHDELTYELVHFWTLHKDQQYPFRGMLVPGGELRLIIRQEMRDKLTGPQAPYNLLFTENGISSTTVSVIAAILGISDLSAITNIEVKQIVNLHLLMVMHNAWQPGVISISGWDLVGALPLDPASVSDLIAEGDTRWINRGAYDLLGANQTAESSAAGMPKARSLYGSLPQQLADSTSFASRLRQVLKVRNETGIATASQIDIPDAPHKSLCVMVHRLSGDDLQLTVLNYGPEDITEPIGSEHLPVGWAVIDADSGQKVAIVDIDHTFTIALGPYGGRFLIVRAPSAG